MNARHGPAGPRACLCGATFPSPKKLRKHLARFERLREPTVFEAAPVPRSSHQGRRRGSYG